MLNYLLNNVSAFSKRFNCPSIGILSLDAVAYLHEQIGNPTNPSMYSEPLLPFEGKLTYFQRIISFLFQSVLRLFLKQNIEHQNKLARKFFGDDIPHLDVLMRNSSLTFLNVNPVMHGIRPVTPSTIIIGGGTHLDEPKDLPKVSETETIVEKNLIHNGHVNLVYSMNRQLLLSTQLL